MRGASGDDRRMPARMSRDNGKDPRNLDNVMVAEYRLEDPICLISTGFPTTVWRGTKRRADQAGCCVITVGLSGGQVRRLPEGEKLITVNSFGQMHSKSSDARRGGSAYGGSLPVDVITPGEFWKSERAAAESGRTLQVNGRALRVNGRALRVYMKATSWHLVTPSFHAPAWECGLTGTSATTVCVVFIHAGAWEQKPPPPVGAACSQKGGPVPRNAAQASHNLCAMRPVIPFILVRIWDPSFSYPLILI